MSSTPDALNRTVFTILGLVLLAAGAYGLARSLGAFGDTQADESLLTSRITGNFSRIDDWFWPLVAFVFLVLAYLFWRWLKAQLTPAPSVSEIDLSRDSAEGRTRLLSSGATSALAEDIQRDPAVQSASARVRDDGRTPEVDVRVDIAENFDVDAARRRIEDEALQRFAQAVEADSVRAHLQIALAEATGRTVR
jgi:hypothetical protein